jgi:hypothetical protein
VTNIAIRRAVANDLKPLAALARKTFADAFGHSFGARDLRAHLEMNLSDEFFAQFLREDVILIAALRGEMIGFVQIGSAKPERYAFEIARNDQELRRIYVLENITAKAWAAPESKPPCRLPRPPLSDVSFWTSGRKISRRADSMSDEISRSAANEPSARLLGRRQGSS